MLIVDGRLSCMPLAGLVWNGKPGEDLRVVRFTVSAGLGHPIEVVFECGRGPAAARGAESLASRFKAGDPIRAAALAYHERTDHATPALVLSRITSLTVAGEVIKAP